jgi:hypothetical protein
MNAEISCRYRTARAVPLLFGAESGWHWNSAARSTSRHTHHREITKSIQSRQSAQLFSLLQSPQPAPHSSQSVSVPESVWVTKERPEKVPGNEPVRHLVSVPRAGWGSRGVRHLTAEQRCLAPKCFSARPIDTICITVAVAATTPTRPSLVAVGVCPRVRLGDQGEARKGAMQRTVQRTGSPLGVCPRGRLGEQRCQAPHGGAEVPGTQMLQCQTNRHNLHNCRGRCNHSNPPLTRRSRCLSLSPFG